MNAWSLLYDHMNSLSEEGYEWTPLVSNEDRIELTEPKQVEPNLGTSSRPWKYNEEEIVRELLQYIRGTYGQHYAANDQNIQTLDFIEASHGDGEAFSRDNILKYTSRYDKKGTPKRDIMKIMHYAVLLMFFHNKNSQTTSNYETF
tara:strand:- start:154 stop:591 length:438 start_codon:yes stop_codon:yes gene_type:complete